jgi:hypothetical protein
VSWVEELSTIKLADAKRTDLAVVWQTRNGAESSNPFAPHLSL